MPSFIEGLLLIAVIFAFCVGLALIIKLSTLFVEDKLTKKPVEKEPQPKIYLIKQQGQNTQKKPKRKRRSPKIAFQGLVLSPENVSVKTGENNTFCN